MNMQRFRSKLNREFIGGFGGRTPANENVLFSLDIIAVHAYAAAYCGI